MIRIMSVLFTLGIVVLGGVSPAFTAFSDDFNRPDSTDLGPNWSEVAGDFRIESGRARSIPTEFSHDLMTVNGFNSSNPLLAMDVAYDGSARLNYGALISLYSDPENYIFVKVQDNNSSGDFEQVYFYYANSFLAWPGMTGGGLLADVAPFQQARVATAISGGSLTLTIDHDFDGIPETTLTRGGIPAFGLGTGVGVGGYYNASLDNFLAGEVPEPTTMSLFALGLGILAARRKSI